jgi:hypothetical protein
MNPPNLSNLDATLAIGAGCWIAFFAVLALAALFGGC